MLQHPIGSPYQCSMEQSTSGEYSKCTVVIRKREINDDIIEKQTLLIQRMKQDHTFVKRLLQSKSNELIKVKATLEGVQSDNIQLQVMIDSLKKQLQQYSKVGSLNQSLQKQNKRLKEEIEALKNEIKETTNQHRKQFQKWTEELINLRQESNKINLGQYSEESHGKIVFKLEKQCKRLKNQLSKEKAINQILRSQNEKKLTGSQPIKIVEPAQEDETPLSPYQDFVKGSLHAGHFKRSSKDEIDVSIVKSDQLFQDSFHSGQELESPKNQSISYQKSEAQIQTQRCQVIQTTVISRQRIERSLNQRKNNHMKNMDQYTRIMNLSKELNEKEKTIKELQKKVEKEKKNSESVQSKLKEKEKELKQMKNNKSLKHAKSIEIEKEKGNDKIEGQSLQKQKSNRSSENDLQQLDKKLKSIEQENQRLVLRLQQAEKQKNLISIENRSLSEKIREFEKQSNIVEIHEQKGHKDVILQAQESSQKGERPNLEKQNQDLKLQLGQLLEEIEAQRKVKTIQKKESLKNVVQQEYPSQNFNIRVTKKHDEDSQESECQDELSKLKGEVEVLKSKLSQYEDREAIPFEGIQEEQQLRQVIIQTEKSEQKEQQINEWERIAARIENQDKETHQLQGANLTQVATNTNLITGLLNLGNEEVETPTEEPYKQIQAEIESPIKIDQETELKQVIIQVDSQKKIQNDRQIQIIKKERDELLTQVTELKQKLKQLFQIKDNRENNIQCKEKKQFTGENGVQEYVEENFSIRVTQKHNEDSEPSEEDKDEVTKLRGEVELLKNRLSEMEDKEAIPYEGVEEEQELREVVVQTVQPHQEGPNQWERIAAQIEAEDKAKGGQTEGAPTPQQPQQGLNTNLLSNFLMGMVSPEDKLSGGEGEGKEVREEGGEEGREKEETPVRTETPEEELQRLRKENETLVSANRELQLKTQSSGAAVEEGYPEVEMNIRVSVKHDEDSEVLDPAEAARLRQESEDLKERLEELGEGEAIPFLDYVEEGKQKDQVNPSSENPSLKEKQTTEQLKQIIAKLQFQNQFFKTQLVKYNPQFKLQENTSWPGEPQIDHHIPEQVLVGWVSQSINDLIDRVILTIEQQGKQLNEIVIQTSPLHQDQDINLLQDSQNSDENVPQMKPQSSQIDIRVVLKELQDLKAENKYLHELVTMLKSPGSSKIDNNQQQQPDTLMESKKQASVEQKYDVVNSLTIPEEQIESSNESKIKQRETQKNEMEKAQTPRFDYEGHHNFDKSAQQKFTLSLENKYDQTVQELSLKNQEIATLSTKIEWLESSVLKYKKIVAKYKNNQKNMKEQQELQIEIQEEEAQYNEVETQTSPYMFYQEGSIEKYVEELQFKYDQEIKISTHLKNKLKKWQNILKKTHLTEELSDIDDLQIEEENIQLCEVQIQVSDTSLYENKPEEQARQKMKERSKFFLSEIENLRQKFIGEDSESIDSENYSGRNTKRSVGSDQEQRTKLTHERMLELQLSHLYKDIYSLFKTHRFKLQQELSVDNFKEALESFISYLKREKFLTGINYNSFEDIKEQDNDDSLHEHERIMSGHKTGSEIILHQTEHSKVSHSPKQQPKEQQPHFPLLFIENEQLILHSSPTIELNPLYITEVSYNPLSKESYYETLLKLTELTSDQLAKLMTLLSSEVETLRDKIIIFDEISEENLEEVIKLCGSDNLSRLLQDL